MMTNISKKHLLGLSLSICCLSFSIALTSCNSYIEEDTDGLSTAENVGDSKEACDLWVTGVYSKWIYDIFCWGYFPRVLEIDADYITGPDWLYAAFGSGMFQGNGADIADALWKGGYGLIERANTAMTHIEAMKNVPEAYKNNAIGEMKFQKAFAYFLLVRAYGNIPLLNTNVEQTNNPRVSVAEVYQQIFTLLEDAVKLLYKNTDSDYARGHVCRGTAAGLLAKAYATAAASAMGSGDLYIRTGQPYYYDENNDKQYAAPESRPFSIQTVSGYESMDATALYSKAAEWAQKLLETTDMGNHQLVGSFEDLWALKNRYASEFLFSVYVPNADTKYKTSIHNLYAGTYGTASMDYIIDGSWVGNTYNWYQLFDSNDDRIVKGVRHRWRTEGQTKENYGFYYPENDEYNNKVWNQEAPYNDGVNYYVSKDYQCIAFTTKYTDVTDPTTANADCPWPFLRLADIYLIYAEALNETGNQSKAIDQMWNVLKRSCPTASKPTAASLKTDIFSKGGTYSMDDKTAVRSAIVEERAKELACEADRRWDLIRYGVYIDAMNAVGTDDGGVSKARSQRNLLFPIPAQELNTNKALNDQNNPGWK
ncbi:MAG: RagB/SusD family nutrient uptake outer membrane protein [Prevotella sp.]|nr:RagB/SusD family nutrient uptake outer membrane protein [Prevotella sp.]MBQ9203616.1 RagB/SusD family nutrient uptake outer membrane protein [Prevotella sp.]